uniref:Uncharacterized protein n=1 Tax=Physcomitrium patens TaxID=3218 RepID=A0A2K1L887_PHYPA|nr:hypothetical protein PHYPA_000679 [Physcomitrium patens]
MHQRVASADLEFNSSFQQEEYDPICRLQICTDRRHISAHCPLGIPCTGDCILDYCSCRH